MTPARHHPSLATLGALGIALSCAVSSAAPAQTSRPGTSLTEGEVFLRQQQYEQAMNRFETSLADSSANPRARQGEIAAATAWAAGEAQAGHPDKSMGILERAIQQLPDEPQLLVSFGLEAITLNQFPIADQALHAAEKLNPHDPTITYALARLEIEEQHMPDAELDLKAYLRMRPDDASAYFGLGHIYAMEQRDDDARGAFKTSIKLQPKQTESFYQLGQIDLNQHQDTEAAAAFTKVLARDPRHAGALTGMGQLALRARQYALAEQFLAQAEKSDPSYAPPHYYRGLALAKLGRNEEAQEELRKGDSRPRATSPQDGSLP